MSARLARLAGGFARQWRSLRDRLGSIGHRRAVANGALAERLQLLARKFDGLSLRERSIVFAGLVIVVTMAWTVCPCSRSTAANSRRAVSWTPWRRKAPRPKRR